MVTYSLCGGLCLLGGRAQKTTRTCDWDFNVNSASISDKSNASQTAINNKRDLDGLIVTRAKHDWIYAEQAKQEARLQNRASSFARLKQHSDESKSFHAWVRRQHWQNTKRSQRRLQNGHYHSRLAGRDGEPNDGGTNFTPTQGRRDPNGKLTYRRNWI